MMSSFLSTTDDAPADSGSKEPAVEDGWRTGGLPALRAELDKIDNKIHDLLMQRATIVEHVARSGKPAAFRPGREASIIRRLLSRHQGALPAASVVRIWRELLAGTTSMQGGFSVAVCDAEPGAPVTQLAREHFGALTPMRTHEGAGHALAEVSRGRASVAVLPYPTESDTWWVELLHHEPRLQIIARLPFWKPRPQGAPTAQALVVAATPADASEHDRLLLGLECDADVTTARIASVLSEGGLKSLTIMRTCQQGSPVARALVEVEGPLADDDKRLGNFGSVLRDPIVVGRYAVPIAGPLP
jgi:chorismate mutase / prephenate dehydratase